MAPPHTLSHTTGTARRSPFTATVNTSAQNLSLTPTYAYDQQVRQLERGWRGI